MPPPHTILHSTTYMTFTSARVRVLAEKASGCPTGGHLYAFRTRARQGFVLSVSNRHHRRWNKLQLSVYKHTHTHIWALFVHVFSLKLILKAVCVHRYTNSSTPSSDACRIYVPALLCYRLSGTTWVAGFKVNLCGRENTGFNSGWSIYYIYL